MKKAKIVNALDKAMADNDTILFRIELLLTKSPKLGVKCGGIAVYMMAKQSEMLDFKEDINPLEKFEMEKELNEATDTMIRPLERFKEDQGRWLNYALPRLLQIFDQDCYTNADILIKSPRLRIRHHIQRKDILRLRGNPQVLFKAAYDIDKLLTKGYQFDPWRSAIRKGAIGAKIK